MIYEVESTETKQQVIFIVFIVVLKTETAMAEWSNEVKKEYYINALYCSVQSNVVSSFTDSLMSYNSESVFTMTKRFFYDTDTAGQQH
jgi:hypothetical protein